MYPTSQAHLFLALYRTFLIVPNPLPPSCYIHQAHTPSPLWVICHAALVQLSVCVYSPSAVFPACFNCIAFCQQVFVLLYFGTLVSLLTDNLPVAALTSIISAHVAAQSFTLLLIISSSQLHRCLFWGCKIHFDPQSFLCEHPRFSNIMTCF